MIFIVFIGVLLVLITSVTILVHLENPTRHIQRLEDEHPKVRAKAVKGLGKTGDAQAFNLLITRFTDDDEKVRKAAQKALKQISPFVRTVVFKNRTLRENHQSHHIVYNPDVSKFTEPLINLKRIVIYTGTCGLHQLDAFITYLQQYCDKTSLKEQVTSHIIGDIRKSHYILYALFDMCKEVEVYIEYVIFGMNTSQHDNQADNTLYNPDMAAFPFPLEHLKCVVIYADSYDFHLVERFITYAVNYLGQRTFKNHVEVHLYGNQKKFHPNLWNSLTNFCKDVHIHKEDEMIALPGDTSEEKIYCNCL